MDGKAKSKEVAIRVDSVSKSFKLPHDKRSSVKGFLVGLVQGGRGYEMQHVLKSVDFTINKGEFFGIVGRNGSGKSTLLKLLAGIYEPNKGHVKVYGKLTPFIELGVGFNHELTGRENVFLNGALLGFSRKEMQDMYDDIVEFAELERFMDQKLKNYSSGMQVRLAFSIAIRAKSDCLLIDEVLAVGDAAFQTKCFDYFQELKKKGATVVFVSHDRISLERFCDRGILLDNGKITESGSINKVLKSYSKIVMSELDAAESKEEKKEGAADKRAKISTPYAAIENVATYGAGNARQKRFTYGETVTARFTVKVLKPLVNPIIGLNIWQKNVDKPVYAINTLLDGRKETGDFKPGERITFSIKMPESLNDGEYYVEPAVANESASVFYDQKPKAATFFINGSNNPYSIMMTTDHIELGRES